MFGPPSAVPHSVARLIETRRCHRCGVYTTERDPCDCLLLPMAASSASGAAMAAASSSVSDLDSCDSFGLWQDFGCGG